ncbi:MAG: hypothetical protein CMO80_05775 [Verrucomicrobiales bacterium]|nr:hypothetical protein [Verrucomicrobiales bacterium]
MKYSMLLLFALSQFSGAAMAPKQVINLIADPEFKNFSHHLNPRSLETEREKIWWINDDGELHVGGRGLGYLRTNQRYRDYHLVLEYIWGERTWSSRADRARDCGLLLHACGKDGEFAECIIRRWELHPLGSFNEKWTPEKRATDMGYSITGENLMPRRFPLSPEESQKLWQIDSDKYKLQLAAAEPLVNDPVDVVWDAQGRMYVADMADLIAFLKKR